MSADYWDRFWAKVDFSGDCWEWTAALSEGYGHFGDNEWSHRVAYTLLVGPIPAGMDIDHLCRNRRCVNPDHLQPVSRRVNLLRGATHPARNARKTHCMHGHEFTAENTYITRSGSRCCRACQAAFQRRLRQRLREEAA